jgi:hypothetical protein
MKNIIPLTITGAAVCLLAGCETTGLSYREHSGVDYPNYVLSLSAKQPGALAKKPALPIRLAVAQIGESAPPTSMLDTLAARRGLVASVIGLPLPGETQTPYRLRSGEQGFDYAGRVQAVCQLARASGADYVFLFGGNVDSWSGGNFLRIFDLTLIGGMIFPATEIHMEGKGAGTLIDAATRQPVCLVNADNQESGYCPDFFANDKTMAMRVQSRDELVQKLQVELLNKLAGSPAL